jgi:hypothetical protein
MMRGYWVLICFLLLALLSCQSSVVVLIFPVTGAVLPNPVYFEANQAVTWKADGAVLGYGRSWSGNLTVGQRQIEAGNFVFTVQVKSDFSTSTPKFFASGETVTLPAGRYAVILANFAQVNPQSKPESTTFAEKLHQRVLKKVQISVSRVTKKIYTQNLSSIREFQVLNPQTLVSETKPFSLVGITAQAAAYVELNASEMTKNAIKRILEEFETHVLKRVTRVFGEYADVNSDGRVLLVFSSLLNQSGLAVGYFNAQDLFAKNQDNPESNEGEYLYLGIPDESNLNFTASSLTATACHELQHLVNFSRKTLQYIDSPNPPFETVAVNEGLSHLAEDLCGYNLSGGNVIFAHRYLEAAPSTLTSGSDTIEQRGGMYLLLRFLFEQAGGADFSSSVRDLGGIRFLQNLIASSDSGLENVANVFGQPLNNLLWRFYWALRIDTNFSSFSNPEQDFFTQQERGIRMLGEIVAFGKTIRFSGARLLGNIPKVLPSNAAAFLQMQQSAWVVPMGFQAQVIQLP